MDRDFPDREWSNTFILLGHMSGLEEWFVSLCGVSDLSNIVFVYLDRVWFRKMMQLMKLIVMMVLMI